MFIRLHQITRLQFSVRCDKEQKDFPKGNMFYGS